MKPKKSASLFLSAILCLSMLQPFSAAEATSILKRTPPKPSITAEASEFVKGAAYSFNVISDMTGLLSVSMDREESTQMLAEAKQIKAGEPFSVHVDKMPYLNKVNFIITVRPESTDLDNPAVSDLKILTVSAAKTDGENTEKPLQSTDEEKSVTDGHGFIWRYAKTGGAENAVCAFLTGNINDGFTLLAGSKTKIESGRDSLSYYYTTVDAGSDFRIKGKFKVTSNTYANNQSYMGFMIKDNPLEDNEGAVNSPMVFGGLISNTVATVSTANIFASRIKDAAVVKNHTVFSYKPHVWYDLEFQKIGNDYYTNIGDTVVKVTEDVGFTNNTLYVGAVATKDVAVDFKDVYVEMLDGKNMPLSVGADAGSIDSYNAKDDDITAIKVLHRPLKITYALNESLDTSGLTVVATRSSGKTEVLAADGYTLSAFDSKTPGEKTITVTNNDKNAPDNRTTASFTVSVKDIVVEKLEIEKPPIKTSYYVNDKAPETESELLSGALAAAVYSDGSRNTIELAKDGGIGYKTDYSASRFTSPPSGEKTVTLSYMGKTADITFKIEDVAIEKLIASGYPDKTTYVKGEDFDKTGLVVEGLKNNQTTTPPLTYGTDYTIDTSAYNKDLAGNYEITLSGSGTYAGLKGSFPVTVREAEDYSKGWNWVVFGQSAQLANNTYKLSGCELGEIGEGKSVNLTTVKESGKLSDGHDGINYYYRKLNVTDNFELTADVRVKSLGSLSNNAWTQGNQEGFGLMLRDHIADHGDTSVWRSSAMYAGTHGRTNEFNPYYRDNRIEYEQDSTAKSAPISFLDEDKTLTKIKANPNDNGDETTATITIGRKNNNFYGKITTGSVSREFSFDNDIPLNYYDPDNIYVGFFTARNADVEFSNASLTVTDAFSDVPGPEIERELPTPSLDIYSLEYSSTSDYKLLFASNADGKARVYYNSKKIADVDVSAYKICEVPRKITEDTNSFFVEFYPDTNGKYSDYGKVCGNISVAVSGVDGDIYVSPSGGGDGTKDSPIGFDEAIKKVKPGNSIILTEGDYSFLIVPRYNSSTKAAGYKKIVAQGNVVANRLTIGGDFWHVKGVRVFRGEINVNGNDNVIELCTVSRSLNTGFTIGRSGNKNLYGSIDMWPSRNLVLNCESYDNRDDGENDADGYGAKLTIGEGNKFIGSIAHHNIDDGWDFYAKGIKIGANAVDYCIAYRNGNSISFPGSRGADGNGFKLGGEGVPVMHTVTNSLSFENKNCGFSSNSNPYATLINNVSFDNFGANIFMGSYTNVYERNYIVKDFFSFRKNILGSERDDIIEKYIDGKVDKTKGKEDAGNSVYLYSASEAKASNDLGRIVTPEFFENFSSYEYTGKNLAGNEEAIKKAAETADYPSVILLDFMKLKAAAYEHGA